jgi:DNA-binding transcriptional LysR family regulator
LLCFIIKYQNEVEAAFNMEKFQYDNTLEFNSVEAIKQCVMAGVGISILPEVTVKEDIFKGRLADLMHSQRRVKNLGACPMI